MSETPPQHIAKMDWRIHNLTWTTAPFTNPGTSTVVAAGSAVTQAALIQHGKQQVGISIPNATALFLNLSHRHREEAEYWVGKGIAKGGKSNHLPDNESFTFYEHIMASVVFAYSSLEAFVNEDVPDSFVYAMADKKCTRNFNKEQIERSLNLDTKLGDVLPQVLKIATPKGGKAWTEYDKLQDLRDRIIHMKTKDRDFRGKDASSIWNALLTNPLPETYRTAKNVMKYFFDAKRKTPRWFEKCPF
ncbi:MAG: hypothetical protein WBS33_13385 [Verrucomicrobiia bacterium]